ncbi:MAG: Tn3 family transposase, partial [Cyanobacteria bacterium J06649_12]
MKRKWTTEELVEHWSLSPSELDLVLRKKGSNRLGMALLLKFFQWEGAFPRYKHEIPRCVQRFVAAQLGVSIADYQAYDWTNRAAKYHRTEIRDLLGFRPVTNADSDIMLQWLIETQLPKESDDTRLKRALYEQCRILCLEPPTLLQINRLLRSAKHQFETYLWESITARLSTECQQALETLLGEGDEIYQLDADELPLNQLKTEPGAVSLNSLLSELSKLEQLHAIKLPDDLFSQLSSDVVERYRMRVETERPSELRKHPKPIRYTLLAAFCWQRRHEITDTAVELFLQLVHRMETRAKKRVSEKMLRQAKGAHPPEKLLYTIAVAALANPEGLVKDVIYPVADESTLANLVDSFDTDGTTFRERLQHRMRSSYVHHYRRLVPRLLSVLDFQSDADHLRSLQQALALLKTYTDPPSQSYPADVDIPIEGVIGTDWQPMVMAKGADGATTIDRMAYEIGVLRTLRENLRCKAVWVSGAKRYCNPAQDIPQDFEAQRGQYYQALQQPLNVEQFIRQLQSDMTTALTRLNQGMPSNSKVKLLDKHGGWIQLSPLTPQPEPTHLTQLKEEINRRWSVTPLLDMLKETDFRLNITHHFQSPANREIINPGILRQRLLLCLYALGTNLGVKRIAHGDHEANYFDLHYIQRKFLSKSALRLAIQDVANAIFRCRLPEIWGEATTACASDSKQFGAWDQNLMTEWHARYGGRGVMIYWHVEKKSVCIYSQLKRCSSSEVASMIQGVLNHCTDLALDKTYVDTHGQSDVGFAFCHLLGFQLMPRFKGIHKQKLYLPTTGTVQAYPHLQAIFNRPIRWNLIRQQYDTLIKLATALKERT